MKEFWMVVEVYPDIPGAHPTVIGMSYSSFKNARKVASGVYAAGHRCPVVVLHSVGIVESDGIPRLGECDMEMEKSVVEVIDHIIELTHTCPKNESFCNRLMAIRDGIFLELPEDRIALLYRVGVAINDNVPSGKVNDRIDDYWYRIRDFMDEVVGVRGLVMAAESGTSGTDGARGQEDY